VARQEVNFPAIDIDHSSTAGWGGGSAAPPQGTGPFQIFNIESIYLHCQGTWDREKQVLRWIIITLSR
jgi:hypothetical protein